MRHPVVRRARRTWLAAAMAMGIALTAPAVAFGHATLLETQPGNDAVVAESPRQIMLRFNEAVEGALGAVRVYDGEGKEVSSGKISKPAPERVVSPVDKELPRGTYTVTWRMISADSDPIDGSFVFHVGAPGANRAGVAGDVLEDDSFGISFAYSAGRFFDYTLMLLCVGGVAALLLVLPMAGEPVRLRLQRILARAAVALAVAALIGLVLQAATAGNLSLIEAARWDPVSQVIDTKFGRWSLIRAGLALVLAVLLFVGLTRVRGPALGVLAGLVCVGMIISPVASGHASVGGTIAFLADLMHVQMAAVWTGGLGVLILGLVLARQDRWPLATRAVPRFSNLAVGAVVALIIGGTFNGLIQLGAWDAGVLKVDSYSGLWETTYGLLLLAKIGLVIPLVALGAFNNRFSVPRLRAGIASALERRHFLRRTSAELGIMVTVIGVTAVLVNSEPPVDAMEMHGPVAKTVDFGEFEAHVSVEPAMVGRNEIHLEFMGKGHGAAPKIMEVRVSARLSSGKVAPMRFQAEPAHEHGAFMVPRANLPIAGDWQLQILARRGEFEALAETMSVTIEDGS